MFWWYQIGSRAVRHAPLFRAEKPGQARPEWWMKLQQNYSRKLFRVKELYDWLLIYTWGAITTSINANCFDTSKHDTKVGSRSVTLVQPRKNTRPTFPACLKWRLVSLARMELITHQSYYCFLKPWHGNDIFITLFICLQLYWRMHMSVYDISTVIEIFIYISLIYHKIKSFHHEKLRVGWLEIL